MKRLCALLLAGGLLTGGTPLYAKKHRPKASASTKKKHKKEKLPPPGDKSENQGAQGRRNATEDAAGAAEGSQNSHGHGPF